MGCPPRLGASSCTRKGQQRGQGGGGGRRAPQLQPPRQEPGLSLWRQRQSRGWWVWGRAGPHCGQGGDCGTGSLGAASRWAALTTHGHFCATSMLRHLLTSLLLDELHAIIGADITGLKVPDVDGEVCVRPNHCSCHMSGEILLSLVIDGLVPIAQALQPLHRTRLSKSRCGAPQGERLPHCHRHLVLGLVQLKALTRLGTHTWAETGGFRDERWGEARAASQAEKPQYPPLCS